MCIIIIIIIIIITIAIIVIITELDPSAAPILEERDLPGRREAPLYVYIYIYVYVYMYIYIYSVIFIFIDQLKQCKIAMEHVRLPLLLPLL